MNYRRIIPLILMMMFIMSSSKAEDKKQLSVGAAKVEITPDVNPKYMPSGRFDHEHMFVRSIVIDNHETRACLIGADLADIPTPVWEKAAPEISHLLNCPTENIIMSSTHSHSSCPAGPPPPKFNDINVEKTAQAMIEATKKALAKLQPAEMSFGRGTANLNVNRDAISKTTRLWTQDANLNGPSDKTVAVLLFRDLNGRPIAGYMNYAMHANNAYLSGITTADFPGAACCYIEKVFGNDMVMTFTQGASGDQNPLYHRPAVDMLLSKTGKDISGYVQEREPIEYPLRKGIIPHGTLAPDVADRLERYIDALGIILAEEAIRVMSDMNNWQRNVNIWGTQEVINVDGRKRVKDGGREGVPSEYSEGDPIAIRLGCLGIGNVAISTIDHEIYTQYGINLKRLSPITNTMFVTLANGRGKAGYIITDADYAKYTFQVLGDKIQPGHGETKILSTLLKQLENLYDNHR